MHNYKPSSELLSHKREEIHGNALGPFIQDIVLGGIDGIVTTFAVVSSVTGAGLAHYIVVIMGIANLFADGISMGVGNFLSIKSEHDNYKRLYDEEKGEIKDIPEIEREEVREIFASKGLEGEELEGIVKKITENEKLWLETMMREEHGLCSEHTKFPALHGFVTFVSFLIFGSIPVVPYIINVPYNSQFGTAIISTLMALVLLGVVRSFVTKQRWFFGVFEILALGGVSAFAAYVVGALLRGMVPI